MAAEYSGTILNMNNDLGHKDERIAELERLLNSLQQDKQQDTQEAHTDMDIDNEDEDQKEEDDLLSYDSEKSKDKNLESRDRSDDLEENDNSSLDSIHDNEDHVTPTTLQTVSNILQPSDRNLKRRTNHKEDIPATTNRSTRAKTSLRLAALKNTSSSEEANDL